MHSSLLACALKDELGQGDRLGNCLSELSYTQTQRTGKASNRLSVTPWPVAMEGTGVLQFIAFFRFSIVHMFFSPPAEMHVGEQSQL